MRAFLLLFASSCGFQISGQPDDARPPNDVPLDALDDAPIDTPLDDAPIDASPSVRRFTIGSRASTLSNFPIWVTIGDLALVTESNGSTPYFTTTAGTAIPFQIQRWDTSTGVLEAWVSATIDQTTGASFDLHAGSAMGQPEQAAVVFGAPYVGVWHFDATAGSLFADAGGTNNGTAVGATGGLPSSAAGQLGTGIELDGDDDEVQITNPFSADTSHTFSAWVSSSTTSGNGTIATLGDPSGNHARWFHTRFPNLSAGFYNGNDFRPNNTQIPSGFHLVHWVYQVGVERRSRLYIDGALVATSPVFTIVNNTTTMAGHIGNAPTGFGESAFAGVLDEVRLIAQARSNDWIAAEFANQSSPATFYSIASVAP